MKLDLKELIAKMLKCDYVIEEGTEGVWTYRKWSSGIAECWRDWSSGTFAPAAAVGGFYGRALAASNFPTNLFIARPVAFFNLDEWGSGYFWGQARAITAATYRITVWRNDNTSSPATGSMYAIGKWK